MSNGLTDKNLEELGLKPTPKMVFVLIGERMFGRDGASWFEYASQGSGQESARRRTSAPEAAKSRLQSDA